MTSFKALAAAPSCLTSIPHRSAQLEETWAYLHDGLEHIMLKPQQGLSFTAYTNLYTAVYNYCTSSKTLPPRHKHFKPMIKASQTLQGVDLLRYYAEQWDRYTNGAKCLNRIFAFLNRYWIRRERDEGRKTVYTVYTLALVQWKQGYFTLVQQDDAKLTKAVLSLIMQQRNGEMVDQHLVKKVVDSLISLGINPKDPNVVCLDVYKEHFETSFIVGAEQYYKRESNMFLAEKSVSDYLRKAEDRLREEEDRVDRYLHTNTRNELITKCEHVLIREHAELLWENFQSLLDCGEVDDLQRMHALLSRIPGRLEPLWRHFEAHVKQAGLSVISKLVGEDGNTDSLDPKVYVDALLKVHQENSEIINKSFKGDVGFAASLDKACRDFVNRNAATTTSSTKSPELIAKYADMLLRMGLKVAKEEDDVENKLNRLMILFQYLEDKDVFQAFYTTAFLKRMIRDVSASDEAEASMISKLKQICGVEYTNKLQRMFTEIRLSKDLTNSFKERMAQNHPQDQGITLNVMVLGTNFWHLNPRTHAFVVPTEIETTYSRFQKYYHTKHSGRKLTWLWNCSKNELRTNYLSRNYILMTSSYQMAVLLQYNKHDKLSLDEIQAATGISNDILLQVLGLLVKTKVLTNDQKDHYDLNTNFKSKNIRVNLNLPIKAEVRSEHSEVLKAVDMERSYVIQATIVRVMKARKTLKNQELIQEVITQISPRFAPKIPDMKKAINILLEKEYIERIDGSTNTFAYVA
ncbi:Cullin, partial [Amanita rubescens]